MKILKKDGGLYLYLLCYLFFFFFFLLVELSILSRDPSTPSTKVSILNFDQVDKFVKTYASIPEKK